MSDHAHGEKGHASGPSGFGLRKSAGISWMIYVFIAVSLVIIFWQGSNVVGSSKDGHVWPSGDAAKVTLPAYQH